MPHVTDRLVSVVHNRHGHLVQDADDPVSKTEVENARKAVDVRRDDADNKVAETKSNGCQYGPRHPFS